jgi:hypothetical protein
LKKTSRKEEQMKSHPVPLALIMTSLLVFNQVEANEFFEKQVRPLLIAKCYSCHSGTKNSGGLALDNLAGWAQGGDSGPAIVPGDVEGSLLIDAINYRGLKMPPPDKNAKLKPEEIAILTKWVKDGAPDPRIRSQQIGGMSRKDAETWWSYQAVKDVPPTADPAQIDLLINSALKKNGLTRTDRASRRELVRRVTYDLTGLPPTYDQVIEFETDTAPDAYLKVINRLLNSPQYGEHWGRHWLDVVRYADTAGENSDRPLPHAWKYRNWVIASFNDDMPFNTFVQQQLAGDLKPINGDIRDLENGIIATGYLAIARRYGHNINQDVHLMYEDVIDNVGKAFLGMTLSCARCHDHKYDPVTSADYYALYGIFSSTRFSFPGCEAIPQPSDLIDLLTPDEASRRRAEHATAVANFKANAPNDPNETARLKNELAKSAEVICTVNIGEGGNEELEKHLGDKAVRQIKKGEIVQLSVLRNGGYGADSTRIKIKFESTKDETKRWSSDELINLIDSKLPLISVRDAVWALLDVTDGPKYLIDKKVDIGGHPALKGWASGDNPSFFANVGDQPIMAWTTLPSKALFTHPGPQQDSGLAWVCPEDGEYRISGYVIDAHAAPGLDGVSFRLEHFRDTKLGPQLIKFGELNGDLTSPAPLVLPVAYAVAEGDVANAKLHQRGDPEQPGEEVPRRWLEVFGSTPIVNTKQSGRVELAEWTTTHPLFARVLANRVWHWHFGRGIVATPNDFGSRGTAASHPKLLEFLAQQIQAHGYQLKPLHRLILLSEAYQRNSHTTTTVRQIDPSNIWLSHFSSRRLTAEEIRDSLLIASGQLDTQPGETHPFPPEATWTFSQHAPFNSVYATNKRTVYMMVQRQRRHPFLALFDGPDPNTSTPTRGETTVPTQALYFLNDDFFHASAAAATLTIRTSDSADSIVDQLYRRLFQRIATQEEFKITQQFLQSHPGADAEKWEAYTRALMACNEFLYLD